MAASSTIRRLAGHTDGDYPINRRNERFSEQVFKAGLDPVFIREATLAIERLTGYRMRFKVSADRLRQTVPVRRDGCGRATRSDSRASEFKADERTLLSLGNRSLP